MKILDFGLAKLAADGTGRIPLLWPHGHCSRVCDHLNRAPTPASAFNPAIPAELNRTLDKALKKIATCDIRALASSAPISRVARFLFPEVSVPDLPRALCASTPRDVRSSFSAPPRAPDLLRILV